MPFKHNSDPQRPVLVLFRHDLRLSDNAALHAAVETGKPVVAVFILDETSSKSRAMGAASRWWLHHSLTALTAALKAKGCKLLLRRAETRSVVASLVEEVKADLVLWNRRYDPPGIETDGELKAWLKSHDIECASFSGHLLHEPWEVRTGSDKPYRVFTPFWRSLSEQLDPASPLSPPKMINGYGQAPAAGDLSEWKLLPTKPDWAEEFGDCWNPGEDAAHEQLRRFLDNHVERYADDRDVPGVDATSRLSPHLAHGEITPGQIWHAVHRRPSLAHAKGASSFLREVGWREFSWHVLFHNPRMATHNFNPAFTEFPWHRDAKSLRAWQRGATGYPIVDAGMRQLWRTGWMHNRVRLVVGSFLVKHLLIDWREGERWFWDTLVDADPANNPGNWQWVAGSGADAAPYFRIFNPTLQGQKFDPRGDYVRKWVPVLDPAPVQSVHEPWAHREALAHAGVKLGCDYPVPVIKHDDARVRALDAYRSMKEDT